MKNTSITLIALAFLLILTGCGYQIVQRGDNSTHGAGIPDWIQTIYIAPFNNKSTELMLSSWITDELRQEFMRSRLLRLTPKESADVILEGEVGAVSTGGLSYMRSDIAVERRISIECSIKLKNRKTGDVLWESSNITRDEGFLTGQELMETTVRKENALRKISRYMAQEIYHRVTDVF